MVNYPTSLDNNQSLYLVGNNLRTRLTSAIDETTLTIPVVTTSGFPTSGFITILSDPNDITKAEAIRYTNTTSTTFIASARGVEGTPALSHRLADNVDLTIVASHHNELKDAIIALENFVGIQGYENFLPVDDHGNVLISGTLTTSGVATFASDLDIKGNLTVTGTAHFGPTVVSTGTLSPVLFASNDIEQVVSGTTFLPVSCETSPLAAGVDYLVIYTNNNANDTSAREAHSQILYGATPIGISNTRPSLLSGDALDTHYGGGLLSGVYKITGDGSSTLAFQARSQGLTNKAFIGAMAIVAVPLSDRFTEDSDYFFEGDNSDSFIVTNAATYSTFTTVQSTNFDLEADDYIVIMSVEAGTSGGTSTGFVARFTINGQVYGPEYGGNNPTVSTGEGIRGITVAHVVNIPLTGTINFLIEGSSRGSAQADFRRPRVFAIRKSLFTQVVSTKNSVGTTTTNTSFQDFSGLNSTLSPTNVNSPILVLGTSNLYTLDADSVGTAAIRNETDGVDYRDDSGFQNSVIGGTLAAHGQTPLFLLHKEDRSASTEYRVRFRSSAGDSVTVGRNVDNTGGDLSELILWEYALSSAPSLPIDRTSILDEELFTGTLVADNVFARDTFEATTVTGTTGNFAGNISGQLVSGQTISGSIGKFSVSVATNDLSVANLFTVNTISGTTGQFGGTVSADTLRGITVTGTNVRAGAAVSANIVSGVTGNFSNTLTVSGVPVVTGTLTVRAADGSPVARNVHTIIVTTGTLTDHGDGTVTIDTGGSGGGAGTPGGNNTEVQFNDIGSFGGDAAFTFNKTTDTLSVPIISGTSISASTVSGTTVTGSTGQFAGNLSAQSGSFVTSLTVSGVPVSTRMLTVQEFDGSPSIEQVHTIIVSTGTLTDNGNGVVYINTEGGGGGSGNPGGLNTQVQFNDGGVFGGDANFTFNKATDTLFVSTVTGTTGNFGGFLTAASGIYSGDVDIKGGLTITGTAHFGITAVSTGTLTPVLFASNDTETTTTGTALISAGCQTSALSAGVDYLIVYTANHGAAGSTTRSSIADISFGATSIGNTEAIPSTLVAADGNHWDATLLNGIHLATGDGVSTVGITFARDAGTNIVTSYIGAQAILAIPLSDRFTADSDYFFDGINSDSFLITNASSTPTFTTIRSTNFTMEAGDYIVIMSLEADGPASASRGYETKFSINGQQVGPSYRAASGASGSPHFRAICVAHVVNIPLTGSINFLIEGASLNDAQTDFRRPRIFAIKKSLFSQVISTTDSAGATTTNTAFQDFTGLNTTITPINVNAPIIVLGTSNIYTTNTASASLGAIRNDTDGTDYRIDSGAIDTIVTAGNFKQTPLFLLHKEDRSSTTEYRARFRSSDGNSVTIGRNTANDGGALSELIVWEYSLASAPSLPIDRTTIDGHRILTGSIITDDILVRDDLRATTVTGTTGTFGGLVSGEIVHGNTVTGTNGRFDSTVSANTIRGITVTGTTGQYGGTLSANRVTAITGTFTKGITVGGSTTYVYPDEIRTPLLTAENIAISGPIVSPTGTFSTALTISGTPVLHEGITGVTVSGLNLTKGHLDLRGSRGGNVSIVGNTITFDANPAGAAGGGGGTPGGNDTEVQYNAGGAFAGDPDFTFNSSTNTLSVPGGAFSTSLTVSGNPVVTGTLTVRETDGSPSVQGVHTIVVTTGTLVNNGNGVVSIATGGGGGGGGLSAVVDDTFPELGGNLNAAGFNISNVGTLQASTVTGTIGQFGNTLSAQILSADTGTITTLDGTSASFITITGSNVQVGETVSAQTGVYSNSLTVSGVPVVAAPFSVKNFDRRRFFSTEGTARLISENIPGGVLGNDKTLDIHLTGIVQSNASARTVLFGINFGNTLLWADSLSVAATTQNTNQAHPVHADLTLTNVGSASSQILSGEIKIGGITLTTSGSATSGGLGAFETSLNLIALTTSSGSVNTNTDQVFSLSLFAWSAATTAFSFERFFYRLNVK